MTEQERKDTEERYAEMKAWLTGRRTYELAYQAQKAKSRALMEAYNRASPEEQARPLGEWMKRYLRGSAEEATGSDTEHD